MKTRIQIATFVILSLLATMASSQKVIEARNKRCKGIEFDRYVLSETVTKSERDFNSNSFFSNYTNLFTFFKKRNSTNFLKLFNWQYGLFLTLVVLLFLTFLAFFIVCCCKFNCSNNAKNVFFWIFVILFLIFVALFITAIVFLSISQARYKKASCASYSAAASLLYGNPNINHNQEFIGYQNFLNLIDNYQQEAQNLKGKEADYSQIINAELSKITVANANNALSFWQPNLQKTVSEGPNVSYIPNVLSRSEPSISTNIESEFSALDTLARDLTESASQARFMVGDLYVNDTKIGLGQLKADLNPVYQRMLNLTEDYVDEEKKANRYLIGTFWAFFGLGIVLILLFLIIIFCFLRVSRSDSQTDNRNLCGLKTLLVLAAFLAFAFGVCVLVYMAGLGTVSSYCRFLSELNRGGFEALSVFRNVVDNATKADGTPVTKIANFIEVCMYKNSTGYLPDLINSTDYVRNSYDRLIRLIEGPKYYDLARNYTNNFASQQSQAIQEQISEWALIRDGSLLDNEGIGRTLNTFNSTSKCADQYYAPTSAACKTFGIAQNCIAIDTLQSYAAPACVSDAASQNSRFNALKTYISSESVLVNQLSADLLNSNVSSGYANTITAFRNLSPNVENFKSSIPRTLGVASNFTNPIKGITQCSNLQVDVARIERHLCFSYVRPLNILYALAAFATLVLFFLLWALCLSLLFLESESRDQVIVTKRDILTVSEQELVPKY
jgi:hypothetical protein